MTSRANLEGRRSQRDAAPRPAPMPLPAAEQGASALDGLELMTADEVARILRVGRSTVYELDRTGELRSVVVARGASRACRRWLETDVRDFILERRGDNPGRGTPNTGSDRSGAPPSRRRS